MYNRDEVYDQFADLKRESVERKETDLSRLDKLDGLDKQIILENNLRWISGLPIRRYVSPKQRLKIVAGRSFIAGIFLVMALAMFMFAEVHHILLTLFYVIGAGVVLLRPIENPYKRNTRW